MDKIFQIGNFCFQLCCPDIVPVPSNFMKFENAEGIPEYTYIITVLSKLPFPEGRVIARRDDLIVFQTETGESRLIGIKGREGYYACYEEDFDNGAHIALDSERLAGLNIDPVFNSLLALERRIIKKDEMVLHCAYVSYRGKALLFSAPSETGKTTQANLWERYRKCRTINGDRALLKREEDVWTANGWPVCGTSEVCNNITTPIGAIVMLSQAKENQVRRLKAAEAFMLLYSQITVNGWNRENIVKTLDLIEKLLSEIPVFQLGCDISEQAVECLDGALDFFR